MFYRLLTNLVIVIHYALVWILFFGAFLAREKPWVALLHFPFAIWVCVVFVKGWTCPLTRLENRFRNANSNPEYHDGFLIHYFGMGAPAQKLSLKKRRSIEICIGLSCILFCIVPHLANIQIYHDAIWHSDAQAVDEINNP